MTAIIIVYETLTLPCVKLIIFFVNKAFSLCQNCHPGHTSVLHYFPLLTFVQFAKCFFVDISYPFCRINGYYSNCILNLILDSSVGLSAAIQSAGDWVSETLWVRILHSAEEDNLSPFDSNIACLCQIIEINNNKYVYRQSQVRMPNGSGVRWVECLLIIGTGCRVQVFSLILDSSVGLSASIQSAGDSVSDTLWVRILHSAKEDNLSPFDSNIACLCQSIDINNNTYVYRQSQVRMPNGSGVRWAECLLIIGTGCRVQVFSLILDSSVGLSAGIQSAGDWVSETLWVRILHSAEEDNLSPFDSNIACLCQSININNNKYVYRQSQVRMPNGSGIRWSECLLIIGTGCRVQVFSLILDSSVGLSAGTQSAGDWVSETLWVRILHSAEEVNLSPFDSNIACLCQRIEINNNKYVYRQSQVQMPNGSGVRWAECFLIIGTGCRVQVYSLILDSSVGLSAGIQSAGDWCSETFWVRILHSAEEDNLSLFDSIIACVWQIIEIKNNKYVYRQSQVRMPNGSGIRWSECLLIIGMGCRVQVFSLILDSSDSLSAGIQSAGDWVSTTLWVQILNSAVEDNLSPFDSIIACLCQSIEINNNKYVYRQSQVRMPNGSGVRWAECLLIIGTGCRIQIFSLILDSSVSLSAGIQSAGDWVSKTLWVRILHSAVEDNLSPFDSNIACLCQSIKITNNKYVYRQTQVRMPNGSGIRWSECLLIIGTGCRFQVFSLILDSSVGLSAGTQSAGDWVTGTLWVRILHSAKEDNFCPFDSNITRLCQIIEINNNKYVYRQSQVRMSNGSGVRWAECLLIIGTGCRVQVFSLILDGSVGLSAGIQRDSLGSNPTFSRGRQFVSFRFEYRLPLPEHRN